jgi:hypothetical protein
VIVLTSSLCRRLDVVPDCLGSTTYSGAYFFHCAKGSNDGHYASLIAE